ncbi:MAG: lysine--tRNA ligase [SAR202 cluster bacterium]|nr:lysine--tRNA ligase [SAR202 cluster bacterium]HCP24160.1 lysine--tRNA ligase [Dehalococcoidia bacterium]|tara:strand:+ start:1338 stop:2876 length:1539 start_codon:yes stop_codon:yes gene_type:complete
MADREDTLLSNRAAKLERLRANGIDPYPARFHRTCDAATATQLFETVERGEQHEDKLENLSLAGRVVSMRTMGKAAFLDLRDASGGIQALLRQNNLQEGFDLLKDLDIGDHLGVRGNLIRTRTGEITIDALELTVTSKGMRPLPEKFHGLRDVETRYRQRYLDLISNQEEIMPVFALRSKVIGGIRRFLDDRGFLEVDTPILVPVAAGAHAKPFVTHHNALDQQLYLRIATELYLKRLIIGGFDKVYEIGRVFRNEGIDQDHNPEFTLLESYEAYADYNDVMDMVEQMISTIAINVTGSAQVTVGENVIDFSPPWKRISLHDELEQRTGIDLDSMDDDALRRRATELGIDTVVLESRGRLIDKLLSSYVEPHLIQPTFVLDYPVEMSPLAKAKPGAPGYVERFEAFSCGMEIANSFSELNDPKVQRDRFDTQEEIRDLYQDEEVDRKDEDFLTAMEYGMPPTGGLGIGIDRLVMLLSGQPSIRDVLLFPQMRTLRDDAAADGGPGEEGPEQE